MEICSSCLTPKSRPRIIFVNGVCNACINSETKKTINWKKRKEEFLINLTIKTKIVFLYGQDDHDIPLSHQNSIKDYCELMLDLDLV